MAGAGWWAGRVAPDAEQARLESPGEGGAQSQRAGGEGSAKLWWLGSPGGQNAGSPALCRSLWLLWSLPHQLRTPPPAARRLPLVPEGTVQEILSKGRKTLLSHKSNVNTQMLGGSLEIPQAASSLPRLLTGPLPGKRWSHPSNHLALFSGRGDPPHGAGPVHGLHRSRCPEGLQPMGWGQLRAPSLQPKAQGFEQPADTPQAARTSILEPQGLSPQTAPNKTTSEDVQP